MHLLYYYKYNYTITILLLYVLLNTLPNSAGSVMNTSRRYHGTGSPMDGAPQA